MRALLARAERKVLTYAGAALIGLSGKGREQLQLRLEDLSSDVSPTARLRLKDAQWSKPEILVRVRHLAGASTLRHASVKAIE